MESKLRITDRAQVVPTSERKLRVGMRGKVYIDPIGRGRVEHEKAVLLEPGLSLPIDDNVVGKLEQWFVKFEGVTGQYLRWVNVKDFSI